MLKKGPFKHRFGRIRPKSSSLYNRILIFMHIFLKKNSLVLHHFANKQQIYNTDRVNFTLLPVITCYVLVSYEPSKSF